MTDRPGYWFPLKRYGWGWGPPVRWQGWAALGAYLAILYGAVSYAEERFSLAARILLAGLLSAVFITIVVVKGERPDHWKK